MQGVGVEEYYPSTGSRAFLYPRILANEISKNLVRFPADNFDVNIVVLRLDLS
jgi:hypothetical protein